MAFAHLHAAVDALAMRFEDLKRLGPVPFRAAPPDPLACFGPLPPLPPGAPGPAGRWEAPSPLATERDPTVRVHAWPARAPRRGTVILVPPWKVPRLAVVAGWARRLAGAGREVWTLVPPLHLDRAGPGLPSGDGYVSPDLTALRRVLEQTVLELRLLVALARRRGDGPVAILGLSLGGLAALLAATAPEPLDAVVAVGPPADLAEVLERTPIGRRFQRLARRAGAPVPGPDALGPMLAPLRPEGRPLTARRTLVAVGAHDRIALAAPAEHAARAMGAEARVYPRGHLTLLFACEAVRRDALATLE